MNNKNKDKKNREWSASGGCLVIAVVAAMGMESLNSGCQRTTSEECVGPDEGAETKEVFSGENIGVTLSDGTFTAVRELNARVYPDWPDCIDLYTVHPPLVYRDESSMGHSFRRYEIVVYDGTERIVVMSPDYDFPDYRFRISPGFTFVKPDDWTFPTDEQHREQIINYLNTMPELTRLLQAQERWDYRRWVSPISGEIANPTNR